VENTIFDDYRFEIVSRDEFYLFFNKNRPKIFENEWDIVLNPNIDIPNNDLKDNCSKLYELFIFVYFEEQLIGWLFGKQKTFESFYIANVAIFPEHRNKGIYSKLLPIVLEILRQKGFEIVFSRHKTTNSPVIVAQLKNGFFITGVELSDRFGVVVILTYTFSHKRKLIYDVRCGLKKPEILEGGIS
jgi:GNAT superfamily N-acetyltransferase